MSNNTTAGKEKRRTYQRVFIVSESYAGERSLTDIFADILYSAYCKDEPSGDSLTLNGYPPDYRAGQTHYGDNAY